MPPLKQKPTRRCQKNQRFSFHCYRQTTRPHLHGGAFLCAFNRAGIGGIDEVKLGDNTVALFLLRPVVGGGKMSATPIRPLRTLAAVATADGVAWAEAIPNATIATLFDRAPDHQMVLTAVNTSATTVMQIISMPTTSAPTSEIGDWLPANSKDDFIIDRSTGSVWFRVVAIV